jgi:4-hydroxybenzoate polyprenyltransferase
VPGRGYVVGDAALLRSFGVGTASAAMVIFTLYLNSDQVRALYRRPELLWLACPLLFYFAIRMWLIASRGAMDEDPIVFASRDVRTYIIAAGVGLLIFGAA